MLQIFADPLAVEPMALPWLRRAARSELGRGHLLTAEVAQQGPVAIEERVWDGVRLMSALEVPQARLPSETVVPAAQRVRPVRVAALQRAQPVGARVRELEWVPAGEPERRQQVAAAVACWRQQPNRDGARVWGVVRRVSDWEVKPGPVEWLQPPQLPLVAQVAPAARGWQEWVNYFQPTGLRVERWLLKSGEGLVSGGGCRVLVWARPVLARLRFPRPLQSQPAAWAARRWAPEPGSPAPLGWACLKQRRLVAERQAPGRQRQSHRLNQDIPAGLCLLPSG